MSEVERLRIRSLHRSNKALETAQELLGEAKSLRAESRLSLTRGDVDGAAIFLTWSVIVEKMSFHWEKAADDFKAVYEEGEKNEGSDDTPKRGRSSRRKNVSVVSEEGMEGSGGADR